MSTSSSACGLVAHLLAVLVEGQPACAAARWRSPAVGVLGPGRRAPRAVVSSSGLPGYRPRADRSSPVSGS